MRLRQGNCLTCYSLPISLVLQRARWRTRWTVEFTSGRVIFRVGLEKAVELFDHFFQGKFGVS